MPYTKTLTGGFKESYEIKNIQIDLEQKAVYVSLDHISYDQDKYPQLREALVSITNQNQRIVDPKWSSKSTPPKPDNFDLNDENTWGNLTQDQIPLVTDPEKQYFDILVSQKGNTGSNIYDRVKNVLYDVIRTMGELPTGNEWSVS